MATNITNRKWSLVGKVGGEKSVGKNVSEDSGGGAIYGWDTVLGRLRGV